MDRWIRTNITSLANLNILLQTMYSDSKFLLDHAFHMLLTMKSLRRQLRTSAAIRKTASTLVFLSSANSNTLKRNIRK